MEVKMEYLFNENEKIQKNLDGTTVEGQCYAYCAPNESCGPFCCNDCYTLPVNCSCTVQNGDIAMSCPVYVELGK